MRHSLKYDAPFVVAALRKVAAERPGRLADAIEAAVEDLVEFGFAEPDARAAIAELGLGPDR